MMDLLSERYYTSYMAFVGCTPSDTDKTLPRISFLFIFVLCLVRISS